MKIFTIKDNQLQPFQRRDYKREMTEEDLELLIENSAESFFDDLGVLIIGRQVTTNLNGYIDLLGLDRHGNTVVIELKRDVTPREVISQILEYASSIEPLSYKELDSIYKDYSGGEGALQDYHREFFNLCGDEVVAFNKETHLYIIAQSISSRIKQVTEYLRDKGVNISCIDFDYFISDNGEYLFTTETVIGGEPVSNTPIKSAAGRKTNRDEFMQTLDEYARELFVAIFGFGDSNNLVYHWGTRGFTLNIKLDGIGDIPLLKAIPPKGDVRQYIYTAFEVLRRKLDSHEKIIELFREKLSALKVFGDHGWNMSWSIAEQPDTDTIQAYLGLLEEMLFYIRESHS